MSGVNGKLRRVGDAYNRGYYIENERNWALGMNSAWQITRGVIGLSLIQFGWPNQLKPRMGIDGGGRAGMLTSKASKMLRTADKAIQNYFIQKKLIDNFKTLPFRFLGANTFGGVAGRMLPYAGWSLFVYDLWDKKDEISDFIKTQRQINERHKEDLDWHVR